MGGDEGADESRDDHDNVEEDQRDEVREGQARGESELEEKSRGRDGPVDVSDIPDGSASTGREAVGALVLGGDDGLAVIGRESEVGDRGGGEDDET